MSKSVLGWAMVIVRGEKSWFLSLLGFDEGVGVGDGICWTWYMDLRRGQILDGAGCS